MSKDHVNYMLYSTTGRNLLSLTIDWKKKLHKVPT